jgi:hypothetical protein
MILGRLGVLSTPVRLRQPDPYRLRGSHWGVILLATTLDISAGTSRLPVFADYTGRPA